MISWDSGEFPMLPLDAVEPDEPARYLTPPPLPGQVPVIGEIPQSPPPLERPAPTPPPATAMTESTDELPPWVIDAEDGRSSPRAPKPPRLDSAQRDRNRLPLKAPKHSFIFVPLMILAILGIVSLGGFLVYYFYEKSVALSSLAAEGSALLAPSAAFASPVEPAPEAPAAAVKPGAGEPGAAVDAGSVGRAEQGEKPEDAPAEETPPRVRTREAIELYKKGNDAIRRNRFKEATNFFRQALKADKSLALAHRGLGIAYAQLSDKKRACAEYRKYLQMIPPDSKEVPALKKILEGCKP